MNKQLLIIAGALALTACGGLNKNTVTYQMGKYDTAQYYVVAGDGASKQEAAANALSAMQQELAAHTAQAATTQVIDDLVANAKVEKTWRDKSVKDKHYLALAVLPREKANAVIVPLLDQVDTQLTGLAQQFATPADPLADLKVVYKMQPVVERRKALDDLYQFVQADRSGYKPETFAPYKTVLKEKMANVLVGVDVSGVESDVLVTYVIDALNKMGLGVAEAADPEQVLSVHIKTDVDNYSSKKIDGLIWCSSSASVSLANAEQGAVFARFNVYDRAGTSRLSDSMRRSMQGVGEQAAKQLTTHLENYLKTR